MGTFLEELVSPIPSLLVLIPAGAMVEARGLPLAYIIVLAIICGLGRVAGGSILYWLAHHLERAVLTRRRVFGVAHSDIIGFSKRLGDKNRAGRLWIILFALHSLPVFPGTLLSAGSGFIKVPYGIFATSTLAGSMVNAIIYMLLGYTGVQVAHFLDEVGWLMNVLTVGVVVGIGVGVVVWQRQSRKRLRQK